MNIRGGRTLDAPRAAVFAAMCDPNSLLAIIPGCREITMTGDGEYSGQISLRLPGIAGTYRTVVRLVETEAPAYGQLEGEVVGTLGSIKGRASFRLTEAGARTTVEYDGRAVIGGPLARLDSRFVEGLAGSLINQGLANLNSRLQRAPLAGAATGSQPATKENRA